MKFLALILTSALSLSLYAAPLLLGSYSNKAQYRPGAGSCLPTSILPLTQKLDLLSYTFFSLSSGQLQPGEWNDEELLKELRQKNPRLKILISLKDAPLDTDYPAFLASSLALCERLDLQGLDIHGSNLLPLVRFLKSSFESKSLLLTVSLQEASSEELLSYLPYVDWITILPSPEQETLIVTYLKAGVPADKLVMAVPTYGQANPQVIGYYTKTPGFLAYYEIIDGLENNLFEESAVHYLRPEEIEEKGKWILAHQLRGGLLLSLDTDNFMDPLAPFALSEALKEGLQP